MTTAHRLNAWQTTAESLACGRTVDEQIETIRTAGNHGAIPVLRAGVLAAHGIAKPKIKAENCVIFGCYRPFTTPFLVRDYLRLLDLLKIEYTYLDREYCCGAPLVMAASDEQRGAVMDRGREFIQLNLDLARHKEATKLVYCCAGCVHAARHTFSDTAGDHVAIADLIIDHLEQSPLEIAPTVMGYFAGCHTVFRSMYPEAKTNWSRYRQRLGAIQGLTLVDIPQAMCCKQSAEQIIERAQADNLDTIVCPCNWCYSSLMTAARDRVRIISLPELLLLSVGKQFAPCPEEATYDGGGAPASR